MPSIIRKILFFYIVFAIFNYWYVFVFNWYAWYEEIPYWQIRVLKDILWYLTIFLILTFWLLKPVKIDIKYSHIIISFLVLFILVSLFNSFFNPLFNVGKELRDVIQYSFILFFFPLAIESKKNLRIYSKLLIYSGILVAVVGFYQFFFRPVNPLSYGTITRAVSTLGGPNTLAFFLDYVILLTILLILDGVINKKYWLVLILFFPCLMLASSVTAILSLFAGFFFLLFFKKYTLKILSIAFILLLIIVPAFYYFFIHGNQGEILSQIIISKVGSFNLRSASIQNQFFEYLSSLKPWELIIGSTRGELSRYENMYFTLFQNKGILVLLLFLFIIGVSLKTGIEMVCRAKDSFTRAIMAASVTYVFMFSIGMLNLPLITIYPINLFFWISISIILSKKIQKIITLPDKLNYEKN